MSDLTIIVMTALEKLPEEGSMQDVREAQELLES
jgi:hypothetical protein